MADTKTIKKINGLRIKLRTDTEERWKESNPILLKGEFAYISDKKQFMIGDGIKHMFIDTSKGITECLELAGGGEALIARSLIGVAQYEKNEDGSDKLDENGNKIIATDENDNVIYEAAKINGVVFDGTEDIEIHDFKAGIGVTGETVTDTLKVNETSNFLDNVTIDGGNLEIKSTVIEGGATKGGALQVAGTSILSDTVTAENGVTIKAKTQTIEVENAEGSGVETITQTPDALIVDGTSEFKGSIRVTGTDSTITGNLANSIKFITHADAEWSTTTSADGEETLNTNGEERTVFEYNNSNAVKIPVNDKKGFLLLDETAKIPNWALPGSIDEIKSYTELYELPLPGTDGKIYFVKNAHADDHNLDGDSETKYVSAVYRWAGVKVTDEDQTAYNTAKEAGDNAAMLAILFDVKEVVTEGVTTTTYGNKYYVEINSNMGTADKAYQLTNLHTFSINTKEDGSVDEEADITAVGSSFDGTQNVNLNAQLKDVHSGLTYTVDQDGKVTDVTHSQHSVGSIVVDTKGRVKSIASNVLITPKWESIIETSEAKGLDVAAAIGKNIAETDDVKLATWIEGKQSLSNLQYTGNAATASALDHNHKFTFTGDATGSGESSLAKKEDGSAEVSINLTLANSGVTKGTYGIANVDNYEKHYVPTVTVDEKGRVTAAGEQLLHWRDLNGVDSTKGKADGSDYNRGLTIQAMDRIATWQYLLKNESGEYEQKEGYIDAIKYTGVAAAANTLNIDDFVYIFDCGDSTNNIATVTEREEKDIKTEDGSDMKYKIESSSSQTTTAE